MHLLRSVIRHFSQNPPSRFPIALSPASKLTQKEDPQEVDLFRAKENPSDLELRVLSRIQQQDTEFSQTTGILRVDKQPLEKVFKKMNIGTKKQMRNLISEDLLKIKGKGIILGDRLNIPVDSTFNLASRRKEHFPLSNVRLFIFFKPKNLISEEIDPTGKNRASVFQFIREKWGLTQKLYSNTRLDYNCEGLMLFTDSEEMLQVLKRNEEKYVYRFQVKVHGRFTEKKYQKIREGATIKGKRIGPFFCKVRRQLPTNTVLEFQVDRPRNREIKLILQKNDLTMWKCVLDKYGPFTKGMLRQCDLTEASIPPSVRKFYFDFKKEKMKLANETVQSGFIFGSIIVFGIGCMW